ADHGGAVEGGRHPRQDQRDAVDAVLGGVDQGALRLHHVGAPAARYHEPGPRLAVGRLVERVEVFQPGVRQAAHPGRRDARRGLAARDHGEAREHPPGRRPHRAAGVARHLHLPRQARAGLQAASDPLHLRPSAGHPGLMARPARATRKSRPRLKKSGKPLGLLERLAEGPVICAEGYLFEFERRGYLQAGAYVPQIVLEQPDLVESLHREFVHAGSDVVEAFTYYAHRAKLRMVGREGDLAQINRAALRIARRVARSTGTLLAGDICNTTIYDPNDPKAQKQAPRILDEQVGWAVDAGVDFIVAETYAFGAEALLALEAIVKSGKPAVVTMAVPRDGTTREGWSPADVCRRLEAGGAAVVGLNCARG